MSPPALSEELVCGHHSLSGRVSFDIHLPEHTRVASFVVVVVPNLVSATILIQSIDLAVIRTDCVIRIFICAVACRARCDLVFRIVVKGIIDVVGRSGTILRDIVEPADSIAMLGASKSTCATQQPSFPKPVPIGQPNTTQSGLLLRTLCVT